MPLHNNADGSVLAVMIKSEKVNFGGVKANNEYYINIFWCELIIHTLDLIVVTLLEIIIYLTFVLNCL